MASDQLTGAEIIIYAEAPGGNRTKVFQGINEQTGPGGSPDGAQAVTKDNELPFMPLSNVFIKGGSKIIVATRLKSADGMDASDCVINLPIMDDSGQRYLSKTDLGIDTDLPASTPADLIIDVGEGYTVPQGQTVRVGGGKFFMSLENDTA